MSDDVQREKEALLRDYESLQRDAAMTDVLETISSTASTVAGLSGRIRSIRDRGYAFAGYLEGKAEILSQQWKAVESQTRESVRSASKGVADDLEALDDKVRNLNAAQGLAAKTYMNQIEPEISRIRNQISVSKQKVESSFGEVPNNVQQTVSQIEQIENYMERAEQASFQLNAGEAVFMAVEAEWESHKDKPDGIFYVTDQRVIFEQKEKVDKNFLGFGGKMKQEILWEAPIGNVDEVAHENKGLFGGVDLVHIKFRDGAPAAKTTIEIKGGIAAEWFATQLKRATTGALAKERGLEVDKELMAAIADAPTTCPVCGATFDQPIVAGMTQIKCVYCGSVTRLALS